MDWLLVTLLSANAVLGIAWVWALLALSSYVVPGKGWLFIFTPFWLFSPHWFTPEGLPHLRFARKVFGASFFWFIVAVTVFRTAGC